MKYHLIKLTKHSLIDKDKVKYNKIYSLLICCFIDTLRISAPEIPFGNEIMEFYLEIIIDWLNFIEEHSKNIDSEQKIIFNYVLHQMGKLSVLSLLFATRLLEKVPLVIENFFNFFAKKVFEPQQYQDILDCINGVVNEYSDVPIDILEILLMNLCKNKNDKFEKQAYEVAFKVIKDNKSMLGNKIRSFITPIIKKNKKKKSVNKKTKNKSKNDSKISISIMKDLCDQNEFFEYYNFLRIVKELSKISSDFLLKLLSEINNDGISNKKKYFNHCAYEIFGKILSNENSVEIFKNWKVSCNNYFNAMKQIPKSRQNDVTDLNFDGKFSIFKCAIKFIMRNEKDKLKRENIYSFIKDAISFFLKNLSNPNHIEKCFELFEHLECNYNIKTFCLTALLTKNKNKNLNINYFFSMIKKILTPNFILQNFKDKNQNKILNYISKPFNFLLETFDNIQNLNVYYSKGYKYNNLDSGYSIFVKNIQAIFDIENIPNVIKLMIFFYMAAASVNSATAWYTLLHIHFVNKKEEYEENDLSIIKINEMSNEEIKNLINFFNQYIIFVDEKSNPDSIKVLVSILFTLELFLCNIHFNKNVASNKDKEILELILNKVIKNIFINNIANKNVFDILCKILILILHICANLDDKEVSNNNIKNYVNDLLFNDMCIYVFNNDNFIKPKYFVKILSNYYQMIDSLSENNNNILKIPKNFENLLFSEKKLGCISFINELIFFDINIKYIAFYFQKKFVDFILEEMKKELDENISKNKNCLMQVIETNNKNISNDFNESVLKVKKDLLYNIKYSIELIKYELNYYIYSAKYKENKVENNIEIQNSHVKECVKKIFNDLYNTINKQIPISNILLSNYKKDKKSTNKKSDSKEKKSEMIKQKNLILDLININYIQNYIDLLFYMSEIGICFSFRKLVKISNIILLSDKRIRFYFISKVNKSLNKIKKSHRNIIKLYSIILLAFSDPNEEIEKFAKETFENLLILINDKLIQYKGKLNTEGYVYIPEVFICYLIIFFIFNANLNLYYQQIEFFNNKQSTKNTKYFNNILVYFFKEIKKKFKSIDSAFLLRELNEIKKFECKNIKKIKCIDPNNLFLLILDKEDYKKEGEEFIELNYDKVKNSIIDNIMSIIYNDYLSDFKREENGEGIIPQIPNIFTGKDKEMKDKYIFEDNNTDKSVLLPISKKKEDVENNLEKKGKKFSFNSYFNEAGDNENDN